MVRCIVEYMTSPTFSDALIPRLMLIRTLTHSKYLVFLWFQTSQRMSPLRKRSSDHHRPRVPPTASPSVSSTTPDRTIFIIHSKPSSCFALYQHALLLAEDSIDLALKESKLQFQAYLSRPSDSSMNFFDIRCS